MTWSCSDEILDPDIAPNTKEITNFILTDYTVDDPSSVIRTFDYEINTDRIVSMSGFHEIDQLNFERIYTYSGGRLSKIEALSNGNTTNTYAYNYDNNGELVEYKSQSLDAGNITNTGRVLFNHSNDTIFSKWESSTDGINYVPRIDMKLVLDENMNGIYYEEYSYINDQISYINSVYSNNNLISETRFEFVESQNAFLQMLQNNHEYDQNTNLLSKINDATFSRKTQMMLYNLNNNNINNYKARNISKNNLTNFTTTFGNPTFLRLDVTNLLDHDNDVFSSDFRTIINGDLFTRFSHEFIFSD